MFFHIVQGWGTLAATIAIAPFVLALLVAGPVAGILLSRYRPRTLVAGGMLALGLGDLAFALVTPSTPYLFFIVPFIAIGAGFVIATTVRTAIIFASVPRRLPSTAAALNQTSLLVGSQLGVVVVTTLIGVFSTRELESQITSSTPAEQTATLSEFASLPPGPRHLVLWGVRGGHELHHRVAVRRRVRGRAGGGDGLHRRRHGHRVGAGLAGHGPLGGGGVGLGAP